MSGTISRTIYNLTASLVFVLMIWAIIFFGTAGHPLILLMLFLIGMVALALQTIALIFVAFAGWLTAVRPSLEYPPTTRKYIALACAAWLINIALFVWALFLANQGATILH